VWTCSRRSGTCGSPTWVDGRSQTSCIGKAEAAKARGGNGTTANRLRGLLQRLLNKGVAWGLLDANPADKVSRVVEENARSRVLADEELAVLWGEIGKLPDYRTRSILQLLVLTGQRLGEVAG
jgi:integrase